MNFFAVAGEHIIVALSENLIQKPYYERNFPSDRYPSYEEARKYVRLVLVSHHFSQGSIEPNLPAAIDVGGMHIKSANLSALPHVKKFSFNRNNNFNNKKIINYRISGIFWTMLSMVQYFSVLVQMQKVHKSLLPYSREFCDHFQNLNKK